MKKKIPISKKKVVKKKPQPPKRKAFSLEAVTGTEYRVREYLIEGDTVLKEEVVFQDLLEMCLDKVDQYVARGVVDV